MARSKRGALVAQTAKPKTAICFAPKRCKDAYEQVHVTRELLGALCWRACASIALLSRSLTSRCLVDGALTLLCRSLLTSWRRALTCWTS